MPQICLAQNIYTYVRYVLLIRFSFLLMIGHPVTLGYMILGCVTPMHHPMSMGSSADCTPPSRCRA